MIEYIVRGCGRVDVGGCVVVMGGMVVWRSVVVVYGLISFAARSEATLCLLARWFLEFSCARPFS